MDSTGKSAPASFKVLRALRIIAWVILFLWAGFWIFFNVASGISEMAEGGVQMLLEHLVMPLLVIITLFICWRFPLFGGVILIVEAVLVFFFFRIYAFAKPSDLVLLLTFPLPALIAGILLIFVSVGGVGFGSQTAQPPKAKS